MRVAKEAWKRAAKSSGGDPDDIEVDVDPKIYPTDDGNAWVSAAVYASRGIALSEPRCCDECSSEAPMSYHEDVVVDGKTAHGWICYDCGPVHLTEVSWEE